MFRRRVVTGVVALAVLVTAPAAQGVVAQPAHSGQHAQHAQQTQQAAHAPQRRKPHVSWSNTSYVAGDGTKVSAHGKLRHGRHKIRMQVKIARGWHTFAKAKSKRSGKFHIAGTLAWFGTHKVRIRTAGRHSIKRSHKVYANPGYVPRGLRSDHEFLKSGGRTFRLNPCKTVRYKVNYDDTGEAGLALAQAAAAQLAWATGIKLKYVGQTHVIPFHKKRTRLPKGVDLVIAYADETEVPGFATGQPVDGLGGALSGYAGRTAHGKRVWLTKTAGVTMNTTYFFNGIDYPAMAGPTWTVGSTLIHELGHAFGLAHTPAADQIMYAGVGPPDPDGVYRALYAAGDRAGLDTVGLGSGCVRIERHRGRRMAAAPVPAPMS